jgi:hypothetical protein
LIAPYNYDVRHTYIASALGPRFLVVECAPEKNGARFINIVFYLIIIKYKSINEKLETVDVKCLKMLRKS